MYLKGICGPCCSGVLLWRSRERNGESTTGLRSLICPKISRRSPAKSDGRYRNVEPLLQLNASRVTLSVVPCDRWQLASSNYVCTFVRASPSTAAATIKSPYRKPVFLQAFFYFGSRYIGTVPVKRVLILVKGAMDKMREGRSR